MKLKITFFLILFAQLVIAQDRIDFLTKNQVDLRKEKPNIGEEFNIIGFGALHGSAKTYEAELRLVTTLLDNNLLDYYIIETNYSQAFYFQKYLETGDENLLRELVLGFQSIVSQEGTIETFNHWKNIRALQLKYPNRKIKILGCDVINEYQFPLKHLLSLTEDDSSWTQRENIKQAVSQENVNFTIWGKGLNEKVKFFVEDYLSNKEKYAPLINDIEVFDYIIQNLNYNFEDKREREKIIFENYLFWKEKLGLENKKQFAKYGYFHIQKQREGNYPSFFTRLIENEVYDREKVITIMGYLTNSKVLWDKKYDKEDNYKGYTTKAGYGISDYWREYFEGIKYLKKTKCSDLAMFKLNTKNSPYSEGIDLVELKMIFKDYNTTKLEGKNTLQFIDYCILISDSKEQVPLEEKRKR